VFYLFHTSPVHWNAANLETLHGSSASQKVRSLEGMHSINEIAIEERSIALLTAIRSGEGTQVKAARDELKNAMQRDNALRSEVKAMLPESERRDDDHIFLSFALSYLPHGIIGLLLAVMLCASMSTTSAELNALASTTTLDVIKRDWKETEQVRATQWATVAYGALAMLFAASIATYFGNLITAVNEIGSLFYGTILGVFLVAFFLKAVQGRAVFFAAVMAEATIITIYVLQRTHAIGEIGFLWFNLIAPVIVVTVSLLLQTLTKEQPQPSQP
jgi:Na+/proline symporter